MNWATTNELIAKGVDPRFAELRRLRFAKGLTIAQVASLSGLHHSAVRRLENGRVGHDSVMIEQRVASIRAALAGAPGQDIAEEMADFRYRLGLSIRGASAMAGVTFSVWRRAEQRIARFGLKPEHRALIEPLLKRWADHGLTGKVENDGDPIRRTA